MLKQPCSHEHATGMFGSCGTARGTKVTRPGWVEALYLHVPFCLRRCDYCDFASAATSHGDGVMSAYVASLMRLMDEAAGLGLIGAGTRTAYLGGGTPTMLGASELGELIGRVRSLTPQLGELSFEANPESLSDEVLASALEAGATRVSIGVQSFNDRELRALGRVHGASLASESVAAAVVSGLHTSLDLMCGIPYQTPETWEASLARAVELGVGHVSCYPLMIEPGTVMERLCESGKLPWPSDDTEADDMEAAERVLTQAGLARYEVASYARPGQACAHNIAYWTGAEYLGLGTAASSMLGRAGYESLRSAVPSLPSPGDAAVRFRLTITSSTHEVIAARCLSGLSFDVEQLSEREAVAEDLMLGARMSRGLSPELITRACSALGEGKVRACLATLVHKGLLCAGDAGTYPPTHSGWLLGNELYGALWDLA